MVDILGTITKEESLFNYTIDSATFEDFQFPDYIPTFFTDMITIDTGLDGVINFTMMELLCDGVTICKMDYVTTGDVVLAKQTHLTQQHIIHDREILGMSKLSGFSLCVLCKW